ncbi:hypothetical protein BKI52_32295 [marine bacterium AO1-C]|nr:hypothetical protein BKI52_32295 [marine bacterium AO1-C]
MYHKLSQDKADFATLLDQTHLYNQAFIQQIEQQSPHIATNELPYQSIPSEGIGAQATLAAFDDRFRPYVQASGGPRYFGFVIGGSTPASLMGDFMTSTFDQTNSSIQDIVEKEAVQNLRELFQLPTSFQGNFVTGATMANFSGLAVARQWIGQQAGISIAEEGLGSLKPIKILSAKPHSSIYKSLAMLGLGKHNLEKVASIAGREAIDIKALEALLQKQDASQPCIVVASAGTVNTGDFDNLTALGRLKKQYKFWLHVDGAFGGFAACSPLLAHYWQGIEYADSITIDAHKWLNVPYDAAVIFTQHQALQREVFSNNAVYLDTDPSQINFMDLTPENSRRWRGLPVWFTLKAYGKKGYQEIVERNYHHAQQLSAKIQEDHRFELLAPARLNVVCFTLKNHTAELVTQEQIKSFLNHLASTGEVFLSPTVYEGTPAIRAAFSNWRTQEADVQQAWETLQTIYDQTQTPSSVSQ